MLEVREVMARTFEFRLGVKTWQQKLQERRTNVPFFSMDTRLYYVHIGALGSISVQAASKWHAEDIVWNRVQAGEYGELAFQLTRKDISVA